MPAFFLTTPFGRVACRRFGAGPRLLVAFHGFSEDGSAFREMGRQLANTCTLYAIGLPFHGGTHWEGDEYRPEQLAVVVRAILEEAGAHRFEGLGHSLGARLWLHLLPEFSGCLDGLYLLAPDGLQTRWLYLAEWLPLWLRRPLARLAQRPTWILATARLLYRLGAIDAFLLRYLQHHLSEAAKRRRLLHTWLSLAHFRLSGGTPLRLIRQGGVPILVLLGDKDRLVKPAAIRRKLQGAKAVRIEMADATHRSICRAAAPFVETGFSEQL